MQRIRQGPQRRKGPAKLATEFAALLRILPLTHSLSICSHENKRPSNTHAHTQTHTHTHTHTTENKKQVLQHTNCYSLAMRKERGGSPQCHGAAMPRGRFSNLPITQLLETSYSLKNSKLETSYSLKNSKLETSYSLKNSKLETSYSLQNSKLETSYSLKNSKLETSYSLKNKRVL